MKSIRFTCLTLLIAGATAVACSDDDAVTTPSTSETPDASAKDSAATTTEAGSGDAGSTTTEDSGTTEDAGTDAGTDSGSVSVPTYVPAKGATSAYVDTRLQLGFDAAPTLGTTGTIKIYNAADDTIVDTIDISDAVASAYDTQTIVPKANTEVDGLGQGLATLSGRARYVYYQPVSINGKVATVVLHNNKLVSGADYYVTVDASVFTGNLGGAAFAGIAKADGWTFHTKAAPASTTSVTVDDDGDADFRSVQGALNWMMTNGCSSCANSTDAKTITIKNGDYNELLFLRSVNNLTITGESRANVVVHYENFESYNSGSGGSATAAGTTLSNGRRVLGGGRPVLLVESADNLKLSTFTLQNTHVKTAAFNNQAETIYDNSANVVTSRFSATHMNFVSAQDTLQLKGWDWLYDCYVAGDVDFIWGYPYAAVIENSELHTIVNATDNTNGGTVFQSRAYYGYPGFVVLNSTLTHDAAVPTGSVSLARSGGGTGCTAAGGYNCDNVAFVNTKMDTHISAAGWFTTPTPTPSVATDTTGWREYGSLDLAGATLNVASRASVSGQMSAGAYAASYSTRQQVFASWNSNAGWNPTP